MFRETTGFGHSYFTYNQFRIGFSFSAITAFIVNNTSYKNIKAITDSYGYSRGYPIINSISCDWRDTTTPWTSLGTISFPQPSSGEILIRRLK